MGINCEKCNARCCKTQYVEIMEDEWEIIQETLGAEKMPQPNKDFGELKIYDPPCPFLEGNRCSIYEIRPRICRCFPFSMVPLIDVAGMGLGISTACPQFLNTLDKSEESVQCRKNAFQDEVMTFGIASKVFEKMSKKKKDAYRTYQEKRAKIIRDGLGDNMEEIILFYSVSPLHHIASVMKKVTDMAMEDKQDEPPAD